MNIFKKNFEQFSDEQLMEKIRNNDVPAFEELYRRYSDRLLYYFYRMLHGNEEKAQDFLQDTFVKILEKSHYFDINRSFSHWIFAIAHNMCRNEYRRREVRKNQSDDIDIDQVFISAERNSHGINEKLEQNEFLNALFTELKKFDTASNSTFILRFQEHFTIKQISEILNCKEGTVKSRLFYITRKLALKLKDFNPELKEVVINEK
jgi:RNA polymerase sigma-70 factor (ECF subfamily)